ncbi:MAG: ABC transporter substrate-binding protein [Gordonia sp. (in: high G+C Gram-positive bacteria)]
MREACGGARSRRSRIGIGIGVGLAVLTLGISGCSQDTPLTTPDGKLISTSTTRIAEVNVVSADRNYARTCLAPTAPDPGQPDVGAIVVTDPALLDAVCALGIGPKVTAITSAAGAIPEYLGPQLASVPTIGTHPDTAAVTAAAPDIVLTTPATAAAAHPFTSARVVTITPGDWRTEFLAVAGALHRTDSGRQRLADLRAAAAKIGNRLDASHAQVSLVRFTGDGEVIAGTDSFAGQILSAVGVQRPAYQRLTGTTLVTDKNFTHADADLIYVSFEGAKGLEHGKQVLLSDRWLNLGAAGWKRVLSVNDDLWYRSPGLAAAWLVLNDIRTSLNGSSSDY